MKSVVAIILIKVSLKHFTLTSIQTCQLDKFVIEFNCILK